MTATPEQPMATEPEAERYRKGRRTFTWLAVFFCTLFVAAIVWQFYLINERAKQMRGDGINAHTYGFDLSNLAVPGDTLVGARMKKDGVYPLNDPMRVTLENMVELKRYGPRYMTIDVVDHIADGPGGAFKRILVDSDRVIGVELGGAVRAYPLRYMRWHEVANDTLGGEPIAVTYSPHADGAVAFKRTVGGEVLTFGHSGLVFNSYHVLYDIRPIGKAEDEAHDEKAESLWAPLLLGPIAGPAVGRGDALEPVRVWFGSWKDWRAMHPATTVLVGDAKFGKRYKDNYLARQRYFENEQIRKEFPVKPMPPTGEDDLRAFRRVVAFKSSEGWQMLPMPDEGHPEGVPADVPTMYTRWFAWHAMRAAD